MAPDQPTSVPAGWYPDPHGVAELRWWDGRDWTDSVHPPLTPPPVNPPITPPATEPAVEPVAEPAEVPDSGLDFPPPPLRAPDDDEGKNFISRVYDLDDIPSEPVREVPVAEPIAVEPVIAEPAPVQPVAAEPVVAEPVAAEPIVAEPVPAQPIPAEPAPAGLSVAAPAESAPAAPFMEPPAPAAAPAFTDPAIPEVQPEPVALRSDSLPSRRELRERGGTVPSGGTAVPPPAPGPIPEPVPDSSTPTSFDWLPSPTTPPAAAVPAAASTAAWAAEPSTPMQEPEESYGKAPTRTSTTSGWFIALMPLFAGILSVGAVKGAENYPRYVPEGTDWWMLAAGVLVLLYLVTLLLAVADRRKLDGDGHAYPAHWAWALLTAPVYLIVRTLAVKRETGRTSVLLWVWLVLAALLVGGYFLTNFLAPELLATYTLPFL